MTDAQKKTAGIAITSLVFGILGLSGVVCPKGGRYTINPVGKDPACSVHGSLSAATQGR